MKTCLKNSPIEAGINPTHFVLEMFSEVFGEHVLTKVLKNFVPLALGAEVVKQLEEDHP